MFKLLQIAFTSLVYPSLVLAYMGQAAYFSRHHDVEQEYHFGFYVSVPGRQYNLVYGGVDENDGEFGQ